jgi:hypothetical protein
MGNEPAPIPRARRVMGPMLDVGSPTGSRSPLLSLDLLLCAGMA